MALEVVRKPLVNVIVEVVTGCSLIDGQLIKTSEVVRSPISSVPIIKKAGLAPPDSVSLCHAKVPL